MTNCQVILSTPHWRSQFPEQGSQGIRQVEGPSETGLQRILLELGFHTNKNK